MSAMDADLIARDAAEMVYGMPLDSLDVGQLDSLTSLLLKSAFLVGRRFDAGMAELIGDGMERLAEMLAKAAGGAQDRGRS